MASWRDTTSQNAQDDLDELIATVLPFAESQLAQHGEFFPFSATTTTAGETMLVSADPALGDRPPSSDVLARLYTSTRANASELRAVAFVADVRAGGSDAIRVELEHHEGTTLVVSVPYSRARFRKQVSLGQMSVARGVLRTWTEG